jgi:uncharacterized protein involved in exopolysaccharide biosynthesis
VNCMPEDQALVPRKYGPAESAGLRPPFAATEVAPEAPGAYSCLRAYWNIARTRCWTILTVAFVLVTLVAIYSFQVLPTYRAAGRLEVEAETPAFESLDRSNGPVPTDATFLRTQVDVLTSDNLAWQAIEQLKLGLQPGFNPSIQYS